MAVSGVVTDLCSPRVVGWGTSDRLHQELPLSALRTAITMRSAEAIS